jgi:hypothetical protein
MTISSLLRFRIPPQPVLMFYSIGENGVIPISILAGPIARCQLMMFVANCFRNPRLR